MSDSDWATRHSTTGWTFQYQQATISWASKKQDTIALSSCEAEIMAASEAAKEALHLRGLLSGLDAIDDSPTHLSVDNQSAIAVPKHKTIPTGAPLIAWSHQLSVQLENGTGFQYIPFP